MFSNLVDALFGCWHKNYSFPITTRRGQRRSPAASVTGTYVVCLDCGKEFAYDWQEMKVVSHAEGHGTLAEPVEPYAEKVRAA